MKSEPLRKVTQLRVQGSRSSEDGHTLFRIQAYFQSHESTIFEARFSAMLALHKCLIGMNKKESFPAFPSRHVFRPANDELVLLRRKELDTYLIELMKVRPFGGMATLIEFIDYQGIVEVCKQLSVCTKQELKKLYAKQGVVGQTFSGSVKLKTRDGVQYVLKSEKLLTRKYFLDNEYDDNFERLRRVPTHSNIQRPEQFFIEKRSTNDQGQQQITVYTLTRFFEQTLESEIVKRLQQKRTFKTKEIIECLRQVFSGLNVLYSVGIYHKNLKPSNIGIRVGKRDPDNNVNRNNSKKEETNGNGNKMNIINGGIKQDIGNEQEINQKNIKINGNGNTSMSFNGDNNNNKKQSNGSTTPVNSIDSNSNNQNNIKNDINKNNSNKITTNGTNNPGNNSNGNTTSSSNSLESTSTAGTYQNNINSNNNQQYQQSQMEQIQYVLIDFDELLHRYKLNKMKEGDIERDRYCINICYLSENKLSYLRNNNVLTTKSYSSSNSNSSNAMNGNSLSKQIQINSNNQISGSQEQNDDMYSLGVSMLQVARCLPRSELQGFQGLQLRQDLVRNYLQDILVTHGSELFYIIHLLLGKGQQVDACYYGYSSDKQQEKQDSQDFSGDGSSEQQQQSIFDMIFKLLLPNEINYTARIQLSKTSSQQESVKQLEYADECLIIKNRNNEDSNQDNNNSKNNNNNSNTTDDKSSVNPQQQQPTHHSLRILLRDSHLSDNQVKASVENSINSLAAFRSYVGVDLSGTAITDESGVFLSYLICNLINIDAISFNFSMLQEITIQLPLLIILALNKNSNIKDLLIDLSGCPNITAKCISQIISTAKSISSLLQFSLYFFNSKVSEEELGLIHSELVQKNSSEVSHNNSCASIKFIYSF